MSSRLTPQPASDGSDASLGPASAEDGRPRILVLYVVSGCDCRCAMCEIWRDGRRLAMSPSAIAGEISAWRQAGLERCVLSGGEPLRHPQLAELLAALRGTPCTLLTSGMALESCASLLADSPVDDVIVSLDGPPELHARIRGRADAYDRLARGISTLRRAAPGMRIAARCTVQQANCHALGATVAAARQLGVDQISFLAVDAHSSAFNREDVRDLHGRPADGEAALLPDEAGLGALADALADLEARHQADFAEGFIVESPAKLRHRLLEHFRAERGLAIRAPISCNAPWVSAVVETDGRLRPCFFHAPVAAWQPGRLGLLDAWRSPNALAFRARLDVASHPLCRRCVCNLNLR